MMALRWQRLPSWSEFSSLRQVVPAVLSEEPKASRSYVVHSLRSIEQLEAEIQQRKHKLDMLVAIHGAWCKALQKPANEHMKVACPHSRVCMSDLR